MLLISFSSKLDKMNTMKEKFKQISDYEESNPYLIWESRLGMLIFELEEFIRITDDLEHICKTRNKFLEKANQLKKDSQKLQNDLIESRIDTGRERKERVLSELEASERNARQEVDLNERLALLLSQKIVDVDIPYIKERKDSRFSQLVESFTEKQIQYRQNCIEFWKQTKAFYIPSSNQEELSGSSLDMKDISN